MTVQPTRLRQIAFVAEDLKEQERILTTILGTQVLYRDPSVAQWGLENFLLPLGPTVLEVVSPTSPNTSASRLLRKRSRKATGYMLILQTADARATRRAVEAKHGKGSVIFAHEGEGGEYACVQYHPRLVPGGVIPEVDSMGGNAEEGREAVGEEFGRWHPCGPDYEGYSAKMRRFADMRLRKCYVNVQGGREKAAGRWGEVFGIRTAANRLVFEDAEVEFRESREEGLAGVVVEVEGRERLEGILGRARAEGLFTGGAVEMCGVKWEFRLKDGKRDGSKL